MKSLRVSFDRLKAKRLKKDSKLIYLAYKRPDIPWDAGLAAILVVAYALSPIDFIPDFVPVLGYLDDIILIPNPGIKRVVNTCGYYMSGDCCSAKKSASALL